MFIKDGIQNVINNTTSTANNSDGNNSSININNTGESILNIKTLAIPIRILKEGPNEI